MTGYGPLPVGAYTFRKRQSSSVEPMPNGFESWTQPLPNLVASSTPVSGAAFCGAFQRRGPTGGAPYRMPLKLRIAAVLVPAIIPTFGTFTMSDPAPPSPASGMLPPFSDELLHAKQAMARQAASRRLQVRRAGRTKRVARARRDMSAMRDLPPRRSTDIKAMRGRAARLRNATTELALLLAQQHAWPKRSGDLIGRQSVVIAPLPVTPSGGHASASMASSEVLLSVTAEPSRRAGILAT